MILEIYQNTPIFQVLASLFLILGCYQIGSLLTNIDILKKNILLISSINYFKCLLGINFISLVFFPIILVTENKYIIYTVSIFLFLIGVIKFIDFFFVNEKYKTIRVFIKNLNNKNIDTKLVYLVFFGFFLLSLTQVSHGDAIGYHFEIAKNLLKTGKFFIDPLFLHSYFFGSGELLIAIGLFFKAETFISLVQLSGIIALLGIVKKFCNNKFNVITLILFSCPVLILLVSSHKPQLFYICSIAIVYVYFFHLDLNKIKTSQFLLIATISLIFLFIAFNAKFTFILSSALIGLKIIHEAIKKKIFSKFLLIAFFLFIVWVLPILYWKMKNLNFNFYEIFLSPLPSSMIGYEIFYDYLFNYKRNFLSYVNILTPIKLGTISTSLGLGFIFLIYQNLKNKKNFKIRNSLILSLTFILLIFTFGQFTARTLLEPFIWLALSSTIILNKEKLSKGINFFFRFYCSFFIVCIFYGALSLLPGSLNFTLKNNMLTKSADGYSLFSWMNKKLKKDDKVLSMHRSIFFGNSQMISGDFFNLAEKKMLFSEKIIQEFYKLKPEYILTYSTEGGKINYGGIKKCFGKLIYQKDEISYKATRNPFNRSFIKNKGYIFKFNYKNFPGCLKNDN